jgi:transcriptional regulator with XRE-family HTH domain
VAESTTGTTPDDTAIGERARMIRRRRGLSVETAAGLAGVDKSFLSRLERGERAWTRRGLLENVAGALSCSVSDLTGAPYLSATPDESSGVVPALNLAFFDADLDDAPDIPTRPLSTLIGAVRTANVHADQVQYDLAGRGLGELITELQVIAASGKPDEQRAALAALAEGCIVAYGLARTLGHNELAVTAARRGVDAARRIERPDLIGLTTMCRSVALMRLGARRSAGKVVTEALGALSDEPGPTEHVTEVAEARGMLHLVGAMVAARDDNRSDVDTHLGEARSLAEHTGERNHLNFHFGLSNAAAWELSLKVESGDGPEAAERYQRTPVDLGAFGSRDRASSVHFDLARAWAQADGDRDTEVIRELDMADRIAPLRTRNDPLARDLVIGLHRRARQRHWELDSLRNRFGVA